MPAPARQEAEKEAPQRYEFKCVSPTTLDTNKVIERMWLTEEEVREILEQEREEILRNELHKYCEILDQYFGTPRDLKLTYQESRRVDHESYSFVSERIL
jgi:hypothetical protein